MRQRTPFMTRRRPLAGSGGVWVMGITALALLAACEGTPFAPASQGTGAGAVELIERDVEAPEIFHTSGQGMWDGRPSLGGVWVAHPAVTDPERVIIRNPANGAFVIGALFRRDTNATGPALQVSSDAATALGLLANTPADLNVTALRRQDAAAPTPTPQSAPVADPGDTPAPVMPPVANTPTGANAPVATANLGPAASGATATGATVSGAATSDTAALGAATSGAQTASQSAATGAAPAVNAAPTSAANATSAAERPYIQLGIFSIEANAASLVRTLNADGLPASAVAAQVQGKPFWRVIVGPAATNDVRARYLAQVKTLGFGDAYAVRN